MSFDFESTCEFHIYPKDNRYMDMYLTTKNDSINLITDVYNNEPKKIVASYCYDGYCWGLIKQETDYFWIILNKSNDELNDFQHIKSYIPSIVDSDSLIDLNEIEQYKRKYYLLEYEHSKLLKQFELLQSKEEKLIQIVNTMNVKCSQLEKEKEMLNKEINDKNKQIVNEIPLIVKREIEKYTKMHNQTSNKFKNLFKVNCELFDLISK